MPDTEKNACQKACDNKLQSWVGNVENYLVMELAIVLLRLVSILFFMASLVFIWRYLVNNEVQLDGEGNTRSCVMLVIHIGLLMAFMWTQLFTLFRMYKAFKKEGNLYMLAFGLMAWTLIDTINSIVMLIAYN